MSPIADCGFPPIIVVPNTDPNQPPTIIPGPVQLVQKGPTVPVVIGFDPSLFHPDQATVQAAIAAVQAAAPPAQLLEALIDTGATESCIDEGLANELQLPIVDQVDASGVGGQHKLNLYLGYIRIVPLNFMQYGRFIGAKLSEGGQPHKALLGRTLLQRMILVYDGRDGSVRLSI